MYYYNARWYDGQLSRFAQADTIIPLESQGVQAWDRYAGMNNNPVRYNDPSGHFAIAAAAFLFHPVTALLVTAIVLTTLHNVLPGREERTAAVANSIERVVEMAKRPLSETEKKRIEMTSNPSGASEPTGPIEACKTTGGKFLCGIFILGIVSKMVTSGANGEDESNSHIVLSPNQPDTTVSGETFITAPQYPSFDGYVPEVIDLGPLTPKLEIPTIVPQKPANQEIFHPSPKRFWGGGGSKPLMY